MKQSERKRKKVHRTIIIIIYKRMHMKISTSKLKEKEQIMSGA